jgi:hypothetical protein
MIRKSLYSGKFLMTSFSQLWENQERDRHHSLIRQLKWELTNEKDKGPEFTVKVPLQSAPSPSQPVSAPQDLRSPRTNTAFQHPTPRKRLSYEVR